MADKCHFGLEAALSGCYLARMTIETIVFGRRYVIVVASDGRVTVRLASEETE